MDFIWDLTLPRIPWLQFSTQCFACMVVLWDRKTFPELSLRQFPASPVKQALGSSPMRLLSVHPGFSSSSKRKKQRGWLGLIIFYFSISKIVVCYLFCIICLNCAVDFTTFVPSSWLVELELCSLWRGPACRLASRWVWPQEVRHDKQELSGSNFSPLHFYRALQGVEPGLYKTVQNTWFSYASKMLQNSINSMHSFVSLTISI